ncbi:MAG: hypothetical protein QOJ65_2658 [Fimbriimonadaceae bacterium]|jgi:hypothetical protein|nr:hypothetical protein [Fimbriimonadaceae bacterium]
MDHSPIRRDIHRWDRRVVLAIATVYILTTAIYFLGGQGRSAVLEPLQLAFVIGGSVLGFLLLVPAYLSIRWGFILQLVLIVLALLGFVVNLAAPRSGAVPEAPPYFAMRVVVKICDLLFASYITWRLATWTK